MRGVAHNQTGMSVIEVLVALSMAGIIIASVGNLVSSIHHVDATSTIREQALAHAKQVLEVLDAIAPTSFGCKCSLVGNCTGTLCTRKDGDNQQCTVPGPYTSCWTQNPNGFLGSPYHLVASGTSWVFAAGAATVPSNSSLTESIKFTIVSADSNVQDAEVTVSWNDRGTTKQVVLTSRLTAWKNL